MGENLEERIESVRELLYKKIEEDVNRKDIQQISENLNELIVDYIKKEE